MLTARPRFPQDPSRYAVVYQWWTPFPETPVRLLPSMPILASVATVRDHCPGVPVYVLDYSERPCNWEGFEARLGFRVVRRRCGLADISFRYRKSPRPEEVAKADRVFREHLSRPMDVWGLSREIPQRYVVYSDTDMMWRGSPVPAGGDADRLHCHPSNTGVFYFDKESKRAGKFLFTWIGLSMLASRSRDFRERMYEDQPWFNAVQDEMVFIYVRQSMPDHFRECVAVLPPSQNMCPSDYATSLDAIPACRALHLQQKAFGSARGLVPWVLEEFAPAIERHFTDQENRETYQKVYGLKGRYSLRTVAEGIRNKDPEARKVYESFLGVLDDNSVEKSAR